MTDTKKTILLVEDDELLSLTEIRWLTRAGYNVIHASTGKKAIEIANEKKEEIDLILMDIDLGRDLDGTQTAEEILKDHDIPILFLSSHTEKEIVDKTEKITSYGFVVKDADNTVLLASIKMAFKLYKANKELAAQKKALHLSEEKFSKAFHNSPDAISICRLEGGVYLEINKGFTRLTGYTPEEVIGQSIKLDDLNFWVNKEEYKRAMELLVEKGVMNDVEIEFVLKDGMNRIGLSSANIIELNGEKCILFITRDITDRKRIEEALRLSEQRFKGITDNLPGMVFQFYARKNGETGLYYVSEQSTALLGLGNTNIEGLLERFAERIAPEDQNIFFESIQTAIRTVSKWEFEGKFFKTNGDEIYLKGISQPRQVKDELIFDGLMLDVTEQKRTLESLQKVSKLQSLILNNSTMGFAFVRNRIQEWANPRFIEIFNLPIYQVEGVPTRTLYPDVESYKRVGAEIYPLLAEGKKAQVEIQMRKGDGSLFWCRLEGKALDPSKPNDGSIWMFEDISEQKHNQEALLIEKSITEAVFNNVPNLIYLYDEAGNMIRWNKKHEEMTGYSSEETSNMKMLDWFKGDEKSIEAIMKGVNKIIETGKGESQAELQRKDGSKIPMFFAGSYLDLGGKKYLAGIAVDMTERIKNQEVLRLNEEKMRSIFSSAPAGIGIVVNRTLTEFNDRFCEMLGYTRDELLFRDTRFIYKSDEDYDRVGTETQNIFNNENYVEIEIQWLQKNGTAIDILLCLAPIDKKDLSKGAAFTALDITGRKQAEEAIKASEEKYRNLIDNMSEGLFISDEKTNIKFVNKALAKIHGYDNPDDLLNRSIVEFIAPESREESIQNIVDHFRTREVGRVHVFPIIKHDGSRAFIKVRPSLMREGEKVLGIMGLIEDITEQKLAEEALLISEERFRQVSETAREWIWEVDREGTYVYSNSVVENILGYKPEELIGKKHFYDLWSEETKNSLWEYLTTVFHNNDIIYELEHSACHKNGETIQLQTSGLPIVDENGMLTGYRGTDINITERKKIENELLDRERKISSLFAVSPAGMGIVKERNFTECNERFCEMTGYTREELLGKSTRMIYTSDEEYARIGKEMYAEMFVRGYAETETQWVRKDGTIIDGLQYLAYIDPNNPSEGATFTALDITERKRVQEQLQIKDFALRSSLSAIGLSDMEGNIIFVNEAYLKLWGYNKEEEILGANISDYFSFHENTNELHQKVLDSIQNGNGYIGEGKALRRDGSEFYIQVAVNLVYTKDGKPRSIMASFTDITERKLAENEIQKSYAILEATLESTGDGILVVDNNDTVIRFNQRFAEMWNIPESLMDSKDDTKLLAYVTNQVIDPKKFYAKVKQLYEQLEQVSEDIIELKDGRVFERYSQPELVEGVSIGRVWSFHDITEQRKNEMHIKASEASLKAMVENVNELIWSVDNGYRVVDFNNNFSELFLKVYNYKIVKGVRDEPLPKPIVEFWKSKYDIALSGQKTVFEFSETMENKLHYYEARLNPIVTENKVTGVSAVAFDITERKNAEAELDTYRLGLEKLIKERTKELERVNFLLKEDVEKIKEAEEKAKLALAKEIELNELKSRFVSTASHEFRTPLTTIIASADLLELYGRKWPDEKYYEYVHLIQQTVEYMTKLINDVLTFSKSDTAKIKFNPSLVNLYQLAEKILSQSKLSAPENLNFIYEYKLEQKEFILDESLITQIISNLISNAVKYSPEGGNVKLTAAMNENNLLITVSDEGIGIPEEDQEKLFAPFSRAQNIGKIPGSGLGLSIVKKSAEIHNGKILLESSVGKGTSVTLVLEFN